MAPGRGGRGARAGRGSGGGGKDSTAQLHAFFERVIGPQRWRTQLLPALTRETSHVALLNAFQATDAAALAEQQGLQPFFAHGALHAFRCAQLRAQRLPPSAPGLSSQQAALDAIHRRRVQDAGPYAPPPNDPTTGLRTHYWLDAASLVPALLLEPRPGCKVLVRLLVSGDCAAREARRHASQATPTAAHRTAGHVRRAGRQDAGPGHADVPRPPGRPRAPGSGPRARRAARPRTHPTGRQ